MPRYVAFLRGVTPGNLKMADLKRCLEGAGYANVRTVLASGNVVFDARSRSEKTLVRDIEAAMEKRLGRVFRTIVRPVSDLRAILETDPYRRFRLARKAKKVITFLPTPHKGKLDLPIEAEGVRILAMKGREIFTAYVPGPRGPVFMTMIEETFGREVTTRTWNTVEKCVNT